MVEDKLGRELKKYDLVLCIPIYSRMKDLKYALYIDDKYCYLDSDFGLIKQKVVYKVNPNDEEELYRQKLIQLYESDFYAKNNDNIEIQLQPGGLYSGNTAKVYYLYLGKLHIELDYHFSSYWKEYEYAELKSDYAVPKDYFIKVNTSTADGRRIYNLLLSENKIKLSDLLLSDVFYYKRGFSSLTTLKRKSFKREIKVCNLDFANKNIDNYSFNLLKSNYFYYKNDIDITLIKSK